MPMPTAYSARIVAVVLSLALIACSDATAPVTPTLTETVRTVRVSPSTGAVEEGGVLALSATVYAPSGRALTAPVAWSSSDTSIATVSAAGIVTGKREGRAVIAAASGGVVGTATITVLTDLKPPTMGKIVFVRQGQIHVLELPTGNLVQLTAGPDDEEPSWSPDGRRIAFLRAGSLYLMNADGSQLMRRLEEVDSRATWSPDGRHLAFVRRTDGDMHLFVASADDDGSAPIDITPDMRGWKGDPAWSPDGSRIAFVSDWAAYDFVYDLYLVRPDGSGMLQKTIGWAFSGIKPNGEITLRYFFQPAWSPDGQQLAVVTCEGWAFTICEDSAVGLFSPSEGFVLSGTSGGLTLLRDTKEFAHPTWSPDGGTIAYASEGSIHWVRVADGAEGLMIANAHSPSWGP